jgi:hypothetical protein
MNRAADASPQAAGRLTEPSETDQSRPVSRPTPTARENSAAQLRARLLRMIVANEKARKSDGESAKPR